MATGVAGTLSATTAAAHGEQELAVPWLYFAAGVLLVVLLLTAIGMAAYAWGRRRRNGRG